MPELPGRPDVNQLRRQARELLRAAADGEPSAVTRIHAVSRQITLSAAQLALAREYGCASWPALRAEAERRRSEAERLRSGEQSDAFEDRWSFGGAAGAPAPAAARPARPCPDTDLHRGRRTGRPGNPSLTRS